jgi:hypothetical protein
MLTPNQNPKKHRKIFNKTNPNEGHLFILHKIFYIQIKETIPQKIIKDFQFLAHLIIIQPKKSI